MRQAQALNNRGGSLNMAMARQQLPQVQAAVSSVRNVPGLDLNR